MDTIGERIRNQYCDSEQEIGLRFSALNEAVALAGINALCVRVFSNGKMLTGWIGQDKEIADEFKKDLDNGWQLGHHESEVRWVENLIAETRRRIEND